MFVLIQRQAIRIGRELATFTEQSYTDISYSGSHKSPVFSTESDTLLAHNKRSEVERKQLVKVKEKQLLVQKDNISFPSYKLDESAT